VADSRDTLYFSILFLRFSLSLLLSPIIKNNVLHHPLFIHPDTLYWTEKRQKEISIDISHSFLLNALLNMDTVPRSLLLLDINILVA
jgi:hypothetical protein